VDNLINQRLPLLQSESCLPGGSDIEDVFHELLSPVIFGRLIERVAHLKVAMIIDFERMADHRCCTLV
tara:strand:- start:228 stop:431 length:204 start_codon:yes stop_codon:yes gene_type:complete